MSILSFNCRGVGNFFAVNSLRGLIQREAPAVIFLSVTKLSSIVFGKIECNWVILIVLLWIWWVVQGFGFALEERDGC